MSLRGKRLLVITLMDFDRDPNQRIQHLVSSLSPAFRTVVILSRVRTAFPSSLRAIGGSLLWRAKRAKAGNKTLVRLNPFLNYVDGLATTVLRKPGGMDGRLRGGIHKRAAAAVASFLGILKDAALVPSFLLAYLAYARERFDVCIAEGPWAALTALLLRRMKCVSMVTYEDVDYVAGYQTLSIRRRYVDFLERYCLTRADLRISTGYLLARLRQQQTGREVLTVPNGVDVSMFRRPIANDRRNHTLVYTGSLEEWAGLDVAMQSLSAVSQRIPDIHLMIIGKGSTGYEQYLRQLAKKLGIADRVVWQGQRRREEVARLLREGHIGLANFKPIPLRKYACPIKVVEYMAAGLPIIGTKDTETALIISRYRCGEAIDCSVDALCGCVLKLLTDPELYRTYAANGIRASAGFDWRDIGRMESQHIAKAYERFCGE